MRVSAPSLEATGCAPGPSHHYGRTASSCSLIATLKASSKRSLLFSILLRKPRAAFQLNGVRPPGSSASSRCSYGRTSGHIETGTSQRRPSLTHPAVVPARPVALSITGGGEAGPAGAGPSQAATLTVTAFPTSFHRGPDRPEVAAGRVQSLGKPWRCSASEMLGVTIAFPGPWPRTHTAGGDGMPSPEPPFNVGTASMAQPRPVSPSVQ